MKFAFEPTPGSNPRDENRFLGQKLKQEREQQKSKVLTLSVKMGSVALRPTPESPGSNPVDSNLIKYVFILK